MEDVHDLHAWTLTSGMHVATAHLVLRAKASAPEVLQGAQLILRQNYGVEHATLQVEASASRNCEELTW